MKISYKTLSVLSMLITMSSMSAHAQESSSTDYAEKEAEIILQGSSQNGIIANDKLKSVRDEIVAILQSYPEMNKIHVPNYSDTLDVTIDLEGDSARAVTKNIRQLYKMDSEGSVNVTSVGTGNADFDDLNKQLSVQNITLTISHRKPLGKNLLGQDDTSTEDDRRLVTIAFTVIKNRTDGVRLASIYRGFFSDGVLLDSMVSMAPRLSLRTTDDYGTGAVTRVRVNGPLVDYVFERDCPGTGCQQIGLQSTYYFEIDKSKQPVAVSQVFPQGVQGSIVPFGYEARWSVSAFTDYADIAEKSKNPIWWVRLHAVNTIGRLFLDIEPWVGEDMGNLNPSFGSKDNSFFNSMRKAVVQDNRDRSIALLKSLSESDPDSMVSQEAEGWYNRAIRTLK